MDLLIDLIIWGVAISLFGGVCWLIAMARGDA